MAVYVYNNFSMKPTVMRVEGNISWRVVSGEGNVYVGICDALNLTVEAEYFEDLIRSIIDALQLLFQSLWEHNELNDFISKMGWNLTSPEDLGPEVHFDVPWYLEELFDGASHRKQPSV